MFGVVANALHNAQAFGFTLPEKNTVAGSQELGPLDEAEGHEGAIAGPDEGAIDVDHRAGLADRSDVQHGLVLWLDGRCMRQNQN